MLAQETENLVTMVMIANRRYRIFSKNSVLHNFVTYTFVLKISLKFDEINGHFLKLRRVLQYFVIQIFSLRLTVELNLSFVILIVVLFPVLWMEYFLFSLSKYRSTIECGRKKMAARRHAIPSKLQTVHQKAK